MRSSETSVVGRRISSVKLGLLRMTGKLSSWVAIAYIFRFVSSKLFFYAVIGIFSLQAAWFATSFYYPMLFDEKFHFDLAQAFTDKWLPFLTNESAGIDYYRDLANESGLLYHFLLSLPLRFIQLFTDSLMVQVVLLRYTNILLVISGLFVFAHLLRKANIPQGAVNLGLLVFAGLPMTTYVAATINYDNAIFLLFPVFVWSCASVLAFKKGTRIKHLLILISVGCAASLMKYTFLPIFLAGVLLTAGILIKRHGFKNLLSGYKKEFNQKYNIASKITLWLLGIVATGLIIVFCSVYVKNIIIYGSPSPKCEKTLSTQVCLKNEIFQRNYTSRQTVDERTPMPLADYVIFHWFKSMTLGFGYVAVNTEEGAKGPAPLAIIYSAIGFGFVVLLFIFAVGYRYIPRNDYMSAALVLSICTIVALLLYNTRSYYAYNEVFANQARYLIYVLPLFLSLGVYLANVLLKEARIAKIMLLGVCFYILSQGGGMLSYLVRSEPNWYLPNAKVRDVNTELKDSISPLISK